MPRLVIDGRPLAKNPKGVGRYAYELCEQLSVLLPLDWDILVLVCNESLPVFSGKFRGKLIAVPLSSDLIAGHHTVPKAIKRIKGDILLKVNESVGWNYGIPYVTVCHDITALITQAQESLGPKMSFLQKVIYKIKNLSEIRGLQKSDFVICNSLFIQDAVQSYYDIESSRTAVGYCAIDTRFYLSDKVKKQQVLQHYGIDRFILTFATGDFRENFNRLPDIIHLLKKSEISVPFIIAGVNREKLYFKEFEKRLLLLNLEEGKDYIIESFLTEKRFDDLVSLYTTADYYLELSLHEGFGMQLAEAMSCGTTCITTKKGALEEVAGDFGVFIEDPLDNTSIVNTIQKAYNLGLHDRENNAQIEYTRRFSWDNTSQTVADCLTSTIRNNKLNR